MTATTVPAV